MEGTPWSSRIAWISSPSAMLRAPVTRTRSPCAYCGRTFRARSCASVIGSSSLDPAYTRGIPQLRQKRSLLGWASAQRGQTSESVTQLELDLGDLAVHDAVSAQVL